MAQDQPINRPVSLPTGEELERQIKATAEQHERLTKLKAASDARAAALAVAHEQEMVMVNLLAQTPLALAVADGPAKAEPPPVVDVVPPAVVAATVRLRAGEGANFKVYHLNDHPEREREVAVLIETGRQRVERKTMKLNRNPIAALAQHLWVARKHIHDHPEAANTRIWVEDLYRPYHCSIPETIIRLKLAREFSAVTFLNEINTTPSGRGHHAYVSFGPEIGRFTEDDLHLAITEMTRLRGDGSLSVLEQAVPSEMSRAWASINNEKDWRKCRVFCPKMAFEAFDEWWKLMDYHVPQRPMAWSWLPQADLDPDPEPQRAQQPKPVVIPKAPAPKPATSKVIAERMNQDGPGPK